MKVLEVCEAFVRMAELAGALGVSRINELPGCWEHQVDAKWWISVNGSKDLRRNSDGIELSPFSMAVKFNGWPAGIIDLAGGVIAAGECANEDTFIAALQAATQAASEVKA